MKQLADRQLWRGIGTAALVIMAAFALTATLLNGEVIAPDQLTGAVCVCYFLGALAGGMIAAAGRSGRLPRCLWVCGVIYAVVWLAALSSGGGEIQFVPEGIYMTASLLLGAVTAAMAAPRAGRRHKRSGGRGKGRKRPVT